MGAGRQRTTPPTPLAAAIRQTRLNLGLSQELFAIRVGVTTNTVKRWERGKVPDPANEGRLLELGVPADEFAAGDPTTQVPTEPVSLMQEALSNQREIR